MSARPLCGMGVAVALACGTEGGGDPPVGPEQPTPSVLVFLDQPAAAEAGVAFSPLRVAIKDASGAVITTGVFADDIVALTLGTDTAGAELSGTTMVAAEAGVATFDDIAVERAARRYTLVATAPFAGHVADTSAAFDVRAGTPAVLAFVQLPDSAEATVAMSPPVEVAIQDRYRNTVPVNGPPVTLPHDGSLEGTTTVVPVAGIASFTDLATDIPGTHVLRAVALDSSLIPATSDPFHIFLRFVSVSAGNDHTCGLSTRNHAYCWGRVWGVFSEQSSIPARVSDSIAFASVDAGGVHTCGLTPEGAAYCWGSAAQLGNGTSSGRGSPTPVPVSGGAVFTSVSAGYWHTCGVTTMGTVYCWGGGDSGALGDGTTDDWLTPVQVATSVTFAAVSAGAYHTCGLATDGAAYCWGLNQYGELGDSTTTDRLTPVRVSGGRTFVSVSVGGFTSCGVTAAGETYCWGRYGTVGQPPDSAQTDRLSPTLIVGDPRLASVSVGWQHACGPSRDATAWYCWGANQYGQFGDGTSDWSLVPWMVAPGLQFLSLSAGFDHTCGITRDGSVYCWGNVGYGKLGDGRGSGPRLTPARVVQ